MKTKKHKKTLDPNADMVFAVGTSIAATGLILLILFTLVLCSTRYALQNYFRQNLARVQAKYQMQFNFLQAEITQLEQKLEEVQNNVQTLPETPKGSPELTQ